jgi:hypothetical protein
MLRIWHFVLLVAVCAAFKAHAQGIPVTLQWHVENRFPVLETHAFKELEEMWKNSKKRTMWEFIVHRLDELENGPREAFVLINPKYANRASSAATTDHVWIRLEAKVPDNSTCEWTISPTPLKAPNDGNCSTSIKIRRNTTTRVSVHHAEGSASTVIEVSDVVIVAMGDSYASGEGSPDKPAIYSGFKETPRRNDWFSAGGIPSKGTVEPAVWFDETCHRSLLSWPVLSSLRLALDHPHAIVRLVNVTCSGATFMDGFFLAQEKAAILDRKLTNERDGAGRRYFRYNAGTFLPRSQVNAVRDALCPDDTSGIEDISPPKLAFQASARTCTHPLYQPDALLMTGGGNDVEFAAGVLGVLMPSVPRSVLKRPFLSATRDLAGAITPEELAAKTKKLAPDYKEYLTLAAWGAKVGPSNSVLVAYPNPIAPKVEDKRGVCQPYEERLKTSFLSFGPAARFAFPEFLRSNVNWVVDINRKEELPFITQAYPQLSTMQQEVGATFNVVDWHGQGFEGLDEGRSFKTRLLCTAEPEGTDDRKRQDELEPVFFCQPGECEKPPYAYRPSLESWKFIARGRRIVNSTNDALLGQRSWPAQRQPDLKELTAALGGAFHPVTESHAVAADAAYGRLCTVLQKQGRHSGKLCQESRDKQSGPTVRP